ncbi:MAG: MFS transporter [Chloroflexi bacterium]|jgi:MFS family permease|nr:MFS transporter [Chloroflexota bacterium]MBT4515478.1 MFS transporter [Chloroflexota bacterium]MBT5319159.1 MFS transporter [Chloroflexota bacterium]MBT6682479.1 MFS transporter [Chloroflexota bacterium]
MTQRVATVPVVAQPIDPTRLFGKIAMPGALKIAPFRHIWGALLLIHLSRWVEITAVGWVIVEATGSPFLVSLGVFARLAPFVVAGPIGGAMADRVNQVWFIRITTVGRVVIAALLALALFSVGSNLWLIYSLTAIGGLFASAVIPALRALYADLVPERELTSALGFESLAFTISLIIGPLIAGAILPFVDAPLMFVGTTIAYLIAAAAMFLVPASVANLKHDDEEDRAVRPGLFSSIAEGFQVARSRPIIIAVFAVIITAEGFAFTFLHLIPIFATDILGGGPTTLGALWSAQGAGELVGATLIVAWVGKRISSPGRALLMAVGICMLIGIPLGLSSTLPLTLFLLFSLGVSASMFAVMQSHVILMSTPTKLRGRLIGIQTMFLVGFPVGALVVGSIASVFGPHAAVVGMSTTGLILIGFVAIKFPQLRERLVAPE